MSKPALPTEPHTVNRTMDVGQWTMLVTLGVMWGGSFFFVAVALRDGLPGFTIIALRTLLAAMALWVLLIVTRTPLPTDRRVWAAMAVMGLINNAIPFALMVWAQTQIASGVASIVNATNPLLAVIAAHLFTRDERITPLSLMAVLVGLAGVTVMIGGAALQSLGGQVLGQCAVLLMAVLYASAGVFGRRFARLGVAPIAVATGQVTASTLMLLPLALALVIDQQWTLPMPSPAGIGAVLGLALGSTSFGYVLYFRILARSGATNLILVTFIAPASAILLGVSVLGEDLLPCHLIGMALIGLGLMLMDGRPN